MRKLVVLFTVVVTIFAGALVWQTVGFLFGTVSQDEVRYELRKGMPFRTVARELTTQNVISNDRYFYFLARLTGKTSKIRMGDYLIPKGSSPQQVLDIIVSGKSVESSITFQEGLNMYEIGELLEREGVATKKEFLKICRDKNLIRTLLAENIESLEGYLFPDTYKITRLTPPRELVKTMVSRFLRVYKDLQNEYPLKIRRHELVTLASIVEKETGSAEDRGKISSVFHNRLVKKMRLQSDPTILYGILDKTGEYKNNITRKDIKTYTRYNTYRVNRLPYGPISNPGKAALIATLRPDQTRYLYFVSRNDGTTEFSETLAQHNRAVREFQILRSGRQGKSWRDLNKKKSKKKSNG